MKKITIAICASVLIFTISIPSVHALTSQDVLMLIKLGFIPPNKVDAAYRLADALARSSGSQSSGQNTGTQENTNNQTGTQNFNDFYSQLAEDSQRSGSNSGQVTSNRRTSDDRGNSLSDFYEDLLEDTDFDNGGVAGGTYDDDDNEDDDDDDSSERLNDFYDQLARNSRSTGSGSGSNSGGSNATSTTNTPRLLTLNSPSSTIIKEGEEKSVLSFEVQNKNKDIYISRLGVFFEGPTGWSPQANIESMSLRDGYGTVIWRSASSTDWGTTDESGKYSLAISSSTKPIIKANYRDVFYVSVKIKADVGHTSDITIKTSIPSNGLRVREVIDDTKTYDIGEPSEERRFTIDAN